MENFNLLRGADPTEQQLESDACTQAIASLYKVRFRKRELKKIRKSAMATSEVSEATFLTTLGAVAEELSTDESFPPGFVKGWLKSRNYYLGWLRPIDAATTLEGPHELRLAIRALYVGNSAFIDEYLRDNPSHQLGPPEDMQ